MAELLDTKWVPIELGMIAPLMHVITEFRLFKTSAPFPATDLYRKKSHTLKITSSLKEFLQGRFLVAQTPRTLSRQRHYALPEVASDPIIGGSWLPAVTGCQQHKDSVMHTAYTMADGTESSDEIRSDRASHYCLDLII